MIHIKRINEIAQFGKRTKENVKYNEGVQQLTKIYNETHTYEIRKCELTLEDEVDGKYLGETFLKFPYSLKNFKSNTLEGVLRKFNNIFKGHKFDLGDWVYFEDFTDRTKGSLLFECNFKQVVPNNVKFEELTKNDLELYNNGKLTITRVQAFITIEKDGEIVDITDECEKLGMNKF